MYRALEKQPILLAKYMPQFATIATASFGKQLWDNVRSQSTAAAVAPAVDPIPTPLTPTPVPGVTPTPTINDFADPAVRWKELPCAQLPLKTGRPRLVVLGTGWSGASVLHQINPKLYDIMVVSPRNHMVFTPLLASTTVGTLEFRSVVMPVLDIQKALHWPQNKFYAAEAIQVLPKAKKVVCKAEDGVLFNVRYDKLAICTGSQGSTFNIPGVHQYTHFLRDISHAAKIREHLLANLGKANTPGRHLLERQRLLHIVVVGGGPTGVEFAGELCDLITQDLTKKAPARAQDLRVTLIEAAELLGTFDKPLREYAARRLTRLGVRLVQGVVQEVRETEIQLKDGRVFPYGLCVWSTGVGPTPFIDALPFAKCARGRLMVDPHLNVHLPKGWSEENWLQTGPTLNNKDRKDEEVEPDKDVFALGDCSANDEKPLPPLAQVAEQQGRYLAKALNEHGKDDSVKVDPFIYKHLGSMATVGDYKAVFQLGSDAKVMSFTGFISWVAWRSAYLTRLGSINKRIKVMVDWSTSLLFGRDLSRW
eukprot:TRINITY_DN14731_c0_g1_i1.p1 TRINITY_DN14731_c0_g1~~TRINITY_DN14731_c0_g1_i1.p1  ORF type:complete len:536 (-),score=64.97 TRINITY_DN14731_c0_g1_i1:675-2282(-)